MAKTTQTENLVTFGSGATIAEMGAEYHGVYPRTLARYTIPVRPVYKAGDVLTELTARALNSHLVTLAGNTATANLTTGKFKDKSEAEQRAHAIEYIADYQYSDEVGEELWGQSLLELAAQRYLVSLNPASVVGLKEAEIRAGAAEMVTAFLNDPDAVTKHAEGVRAMLESILTTRLPEKEKTEKAAKAGVKMAW